jgi:serine/threonine protein kinase
MDGTSFGPYRLLETIGQGGMGQVFRAYDTAHDREVALKVLAPHVAQDATFEQRFRREAHVAARLSEPHVVPIHSYGEIDGRLYVDMRLIAGKDLASVLEESGAMNPARAVGIIEQVADALDAAHSIELIHRDIKPSNILLGRRDFVHLIDFGIAQDVNATRITRTGLAIGTFAYMAPERIDPGQSGSSSDIYSLACVLYECLTGELPFPGDSLQRQIAAHLSKPPPRPSIVNAGVSQVFDEVIAKGMAKDPGERYPTIIALAEAAREALRHGPREMPTQVMRTQLADTQKAVPPPGPQAPWPGPPSPGPSAPWPSQPAPWGPSADGMLRPVPDQQLQPAVNFLLPGVLIAIFSVFRILFGIFAISFRTFHYITNSFLVFVYLCMWLVAAAGFGLIAWRLRASDRALSIVAWVTCATTAVAAAPWALYLILGSSHNAGRLTSPIAFLSFIAFGVTAHRRFGLRWSVPACVAGLLGIMESILEMPIVASHLVVLIHSGFVPLLWPIPLLVLGIMVSRTQTDGQSRIS